MRRKHDLSQWIQPGVFRIRSQEAFGQTNFIKRAVIENPSPDKKLEQLEAEIDRLRVEVSSAQQQWDTVLEELTKEREYLYQVVLTLKKEWELGRQQREISLDQEKE